MDTISLIIRFLERLQRNGDETIRIDGLIALMEELRDGAKH